MIVTKFAFLSRFTDDEMAGILTASDSVPALRVYMFKLQLAENVDLCLQETIDGVNGLEAAGLLAPGRAVEILNNKKARVLPPFNATFPDEYEVESFKNGVYSLVGVGEFEEKFIEVIS